MYEMVKAIADAHGWNSQKAKAIEELAELIRALARFELVTPHEIKSKEDLNLIEELADAKIMIDQIIHLTRYEDEVEIAIEVKIQRQLERDGLI